MSGPVTAPDAEPLQDGPARPAPPRVEVGEDREATVGSLRVRRALPRRGRRTVGAWCFADHMGPADVTEGAGLDIGPHPHIGLQTVTWLLDGSALHKDSLGSEQVIRPGQLNLMTAGQGVSHAEEATGEYRGRLEGVQLWVAQPDRTRRGPAAFEHHTDLPRLESGGGLATVLLGELDGATSPARTDTPLVGVDLDLHGGPSTWPLRVDWEYALVVLRGAVGLDDRALVPGTLAYLGRGRQELPLDADGPARALLIGGEPFGEELVMWWNFVGRSRDEVDAAFGSWQAQDDRFGRVESVLPRIPAAPPPWRR